MKLYVNLLTKTVQSYNIFGNKPNNLVFFFDNFVIFNPPDL